MVDEERNKVLYFLINNKDNFSSKEEYDNIRKDVYKLDLKEFTNKYDQLLKDKTFGWSKIRAPKEKNLAERLSEDFGESGFNPSENWKKEIYREKYQDIDKETFDKTLSNMKQYYEDEKKERAYTAGKMKREKEVKNWGKEPFTTPWMWNILASDYEKQRYINEPDKALFGKEAPNVGEAKDTRWGSMADLSLGAAGAAADFYPGARGVFLGPVIRGVRDIGHKALGSDYQKELTDIGKDAFIDLGLNAGVEYFPTAIIRRTEKGAKNLSKNTGFLTDVGLEMDVKAHKKANDIVEQGFDNLADAATTDIREFDLLLSRLPKDSDITKDLIAIRNKPDFKPSDITDYLYQYKDAKKAVYDKGEMFGYKVDKNTGTIVPTQRSEGYLGPNAYDFFRQQERNKAMTKKALKSGLASVGGKAGLVGGGLVKEGYTVAGRGGKPDVNPEMAKDWYKENYKKDWELGFEPKYVEGDPKWEAFAELYPERAAKIIQKENKE
jgi:hypothetical protein